MPFEKGKVSNPNGRKGGKANAHSLASIDKNLNERFDSIEAELAAIRQMLPKGITGTPEDYILGRESTRFLKGDK